MTTDDDWLRANFGTIFTAHVVAFTRHLVTLRRAFDGDLDLMLVLAVIGERHQSLRQDIDTVPFETFGKAPVDDVGRPTVNAHSLSAFTGIPRETLRRKVGELVRRGWVRRDERGDLHPTAKAGEDLRQATEAGADYIRAVVKACDAVRAERG
jgi:hypothetical protein